LFYLVMELSPEKKNDGNFASCATRNDAVSCHFFFWMILHHQKKKINSFFKSQRQEIKQTFTFWRLYLITRRYTKHSCTISHQEYLYHALGNKQNTHKKNDNGLISLSKMGLEDGQYLCLNRCDKSNMKTLSILYRLIVVQLVCCVITYSFFIPSRTFHLHLNVTTADKGVCI
jgi:hypothetical protein